MPPDQQSSDQDVSGQDLYNELAYYTLAHPDPAFIHQHLVDAFTAQHANESTKPIAIVFALIGLYLHIEKGFTGRQVQKAHIRLAKQRKQWPRLPAPADKGKITPADVAAVSGPDRDAMIHAWCASVWESWKGSRGEIAELVRKELGID